MSEEEYKRQKYYNYRGHSYYISEINKIDEKYGFIVQADKAFKAEQYECKAVISLSDFKSGNNPVVSFNFDDIRNLSDLEKIQEYKIAPITR